LLACAALCAACGPAVGQSGWPARPIRLIVPFTAGSSSDIVARIVAQRLGERLKQQVFVENRVGASGNLGSEAVVRAEPDGYTMGLANASTHAVAPSLSSRLGYDPVRDFAPISMLGSSPFVLSVYPGLPARTVAELMPGYESSLWQGYVMPAGTPGAIIAKANREVTAVLNDAGVRAALTEQGVEPEPGPPEALGDRMRADVAKWHDVIVSAGIHE
jgi:tripartite-type tricarboxylate transporter receptor subunit TctC